MEDLSFFSALVSYKSAPLGTMKTLKEASLAKLSLIGYATEQYLFGQTVFSLLYCIDLFNSNFYK